MNKLIKFKWSILRPDTRQYKQQSVELLPEDVSVGLYIPEEYVVPSEGVTILTPEGMIFVQKKIEELYADGVAVGDWEDKPAKKSETAPADDWGDGKEKDSKADEGWGDAVFDDKDTPKTNTPDTEEWNEKEEEWQ